MGRDGIGWGRVAGLGLNESVERWKRERDESAAGLAGWDLFSFFFLFGAVCQSGLLLLLTHARKENVVSGGSLAALFRPASFFLSLFSWPGSLPSQQQRLGEVRGQEKETRRGREGRGERMWDGTGRKGPARASCGTSRHGRYHWATIGLCTGAIQPNPVSPSSFLLAPSFLPGQGSTSGRETFGKR